MKEETRKLLEKAARAIEAAKTLLKTGSADFAAGRAYYAMFYIAEALLLEKGLSYSKHSAVHASFGKIYAKEGIIDSKFHRWLLDAFDQRIIGDYGVEAVITPEDVHQIVERANEFLATAKSLLTK
jgi:uncharacterized protein (UPF0332 family)